VSAAAGLPRAGWGRRGGDERGNSTGPVVSSVWVEELCLPLTVYLCELREAGAESVGIREVFWVTHSPPPPSLNQTLRKSPCSWSGWGISA
jgi:hypothetical protein